MNTWYRLSLGDGVMAPTSSDEIQEEFYKSYNSSGSQLERAIFTRPESEGRLYCEIIAYFSPAARNVAIAFDAEPCEKPVRTGLVLLAGEPEAWSVLFPEGNHS